MADRKMDHEVLALQKCIRILVELPPSARYRVLQNLMSRSLEEMEFPAPAPTGDLFDGSPSPPPAD